MMFLTQLQSVSRQLIDSLEQMKDEDYCRPLEVYDGQCIGAHFRHLLEFFTELARGYDSGIVEYEKRIRSIELETVRMKALDEAEQIVRAFKKDDKSLRTAIYADQNNSTLVASSYFRELSFVLEHCIHHMALIRIGMQELSVSPLEDDFGVAPSTLRFRRNTDQSGC